MQKTINLNIHAILIDIKLPSNFHFHRVMSHFMKFKAQIEV